MKTLIGKINLSQLRSEFTQKLDAINLLMGDMPRRGRKPAAEYNQTNGHGRTRKPGPRRMSEEVKQRLSVVAKRRWKAARRAGRTTL